MNRSSEASPKTLFFHVSVSVLATGGSLLVTLAAAPMLIRNLGMEAFGLIGFSAGLQAALRILDLGLTPTLIREIAGRATSAEGARQTRDFVKSLAVVFAGIAIGIGLTIVVLASWIARSWIQNETLPTAIVDSSVVMIGLIGAIQWMASFFHATLLGLEQQATLTTARFIETAAGWLGGVALIVWGGGTIETFLAWQAGVSVVVLIALAAIVFRLLPTHPSPPRFRWQSLRRVARFASAMTAITATGMVLSQMDKFILSRALPLGDFGDYTLAFLAINALQALVVLPMANVMLPRFSSLVAAGQWERLAVFYHLTVQSLASATAPVVVMMAFFMRDFLVVWTGEPAVAQRVAPIAVLLSVGLFFNSLMVATYVLQLASGWTRLGLILNIGLIAVFAPLLFMLATWRGTTGAAASYALLNAVYFAVGQPLTHRRLLVGQLPAIWRDDIAPPVAISCVAAALLSLMPLDAWPIGVRLAVAGLGGLALVFACGLACPLTRGEIRARLVR